MKYSPRSLKVESLENHRAEFKSKHPCVKKHTPADFEHDRMRIPVEHNRMPDIPRAAKVEHQGHYYQYVPEKCGQNGRSQDGTIMFQIEDGDGASDHEASGSESDAA